ncbi:hypothetical protein ES703_96263 [subsurface metagenome]
MDLQERVATLEQRVSNLEAIEGIRNTISRYGRAVDYAQFDDLASILTDDVILQPGPWWEDQKGKEKVLSIFRDYRTTYQFPHRHAVNDLTHIDGKKGICSAYFLVMHSYHGNSYIGWGRYDWVFRLEEGIWKIAKMVINIETMTSLEKGWGMEQDRVIPFPPPP